jgi:hypothetical protein
VLVLQPPVLKTSQCLGSSSIILSSKGKKQKNNQTKNPKKTQPTKHTNTQTKYPKFKCSTLPVSTSASSSSFVNFLIKGREKKKGVWRQLCECLSQTVAHLPSTVIHLLLQALFIYRFLLDTCLLFSSVYSPTRLLQLQSFFII